MKWIRFRIETVTSAEDILIAALYDIGLEGAVIEDNIPLTEEEKAGMFVDIPPETDVDDGTAYLTFYAESAPDKRVVIRDEELYISVVIDSIEQVLNAVRDNADIGSGTIHVSETEDVDWVNNWKEYFHQFTINDLLVIPSWETPDESVSQGFDKVLHIDPGTAFGTGAHETTSLVIRQLQEHIKGGETLLDIGTGSGILPIVAMLYGVKEAVGTDLDDNCIEAVEQNLEVNGIDSHRLLLVMGNVITDENIRRVVRKSDGYDIVTANILAEVLIPLTPLIPEFLKDGGLYIISGILTEKEELVKEAVINAGFRIVSVTRDGEWSCISASKD